MQSISIGRSSRRDTQSLDLLRGRSTPPRIGEGGCPPSPMPGKVATAKRRRMGITASAYVLRQLALDDRFDDPDRDYPPPRPVPDPERPSVPISANLRIPEGGCPRRPWLRRMLAAVEASIAMGIARFKHSEIFDIIAGTRNLSAGNAEHLDRPEFAQRRPEPRPPARSIHSPRRGAPGCRSFADAAEGSNLEAASDGNHRMPAHVLRQLCFWWRLIEQDQSISIGLSPPPVSTFGRSTLPGSGREGALLPRSGEGGAAKRRRMGDHRVRIRSLTSWIGTSGPDQSISIGRCPTRLDLRSIHPPRIGEGGCPPSPIRGRWRREAATDGGSPRPHTFFDIMDRYVGTGSEHLDRPVPHPSRPSVDPPSPDRGGRVPSFPDPGKVAPRSGDAMGGRLAQAPARQRCSGTA